MNGYFLRLVFKPAVVLLAVCLSVAGVNGQTVRVFNTSGTFTVPSCVTSMIVMCYGGGGGGGWAGEPSSGATGSGGGGGGCAVAEINNPSGTYTVTVGAAGVGGIGSSSTNATAGGNSIFTNGTITITGVGGGAGVGSGSGVASPGGAGGGGTFVGCTGTFYTGGTGAIGNNGDDNTGGGGGGGAGNAGNGGTPAATTQDNNATGGAGGAGTPNNAPYVGGTGGSVSAAYYENGNPGTGIGAGGGGGGGENQFFHGTGYGNGGAGTVGQVIVVYTLSTPTVTAVTGSGCVGSTVTVTGTLLTGATSVTINGTALTNLVVTATQITGTIAPGTTSGTVTVTTPCGTVNAPAAFTVHPVSTVNLGSVTFCTSYTFAGTVYTTGGNYSSTVPSTLTGCDSTTNITLVKATSLTQNVAQSICAGSGYHFGSNNLTVAGVYKDTVPSVASGCDSITTLTLTVLQPIQVAISQTICSGNSYAFNGQNLTTSGTYTNTTPSLVTGCDSITTLTLTVLPTPAGTVTPATLSTCPNTANTLTASQANTYAWSTGETTAAISVSPAATTTYTVTESNGTCSATGTATITVAPFTISIIPDTVKSCLSQHVTLTCSYTSNNPNSYVWSSTPAGPTPGITQGVIVYPPVTTVYSVTATSGTNCSASATAILIVDAPPISITPATAGVCQGHDTTLTANSPGAVSYLWSNNVNTAANPVSPTTATKYYVTATDAQGCKAVDSITVAVGPVPTATFTLPATTCAGVNTDITYTGTSDAAAVYNWYFGGGTVDSGANKGPYAIDFTTAGIDTVILNVADNGCSAVPDTMTITVNPAPVADAGMAVSFCGYDSATLGTASTTGYTYLWTPATGLSSATTSSPTVTLPNTGNSPINQTYRVTVSSNGCSSADSVVVTVKPAPQALFVNPPAQCLTGNQFTFASTGTALPTDSFSWTFGANSTPATSAATSAVVTYSAAQTTAVSLTVSRAGCTGNTYTDSVTVYPMPVTAFNTPTATGCPGSSICFTNSSTTTGVPAYLWQFGDGSSSTVQSPCHVYTKAGIYTVSLDATANGCSTTLIDTNYVTINVAPTASFTPSLTVLQQPQTEVDFANTSSNAGIYNWNFGGAGTSTDASPVFNFTQYGSYTVTLYAANSFGCTDSASTLIKVLPPQSYFIPNAFTPNGDGVNDEFYIQAQEGVTVIEFTVFDRWGEKVHDGPNPWDGTFAGKKCVDGVYVYLFKLQLVDNTDGIKRVGTVTLIR